MLLVDKCTSALINDCCRYDEGIVFGQDFLEQEAKRLQRVLESEALQHLNIIRVARKDDLSNSSLQKHDIFIPNIIESGQIFQRLDIS